MDRIIYVAMTGAREITRQQAAVSHNLANISTNGFKSELSVFRALPVVGEGARTRAFVLETTPATDYTPGPMQHTGRALDVAIQGRGWVAVQDASGQEAYTRTGDFQVSLNGVLQTGNGFIVQGDGGPITVAPDQEVMIAKDGTVSTVPAGGNRNAVEVAGRIKLVNPDEANLARSEDGLFRLKSGEQAPADAEVYLAVGTLESSNVNAADALVNMITLARHFETQMRLLRTAEDNHKAGDKVIAR